jgi:hypothetical protein
MKTTKFSGMLVLLLLSACSTSKITTSWKAENSTQRPYKKIMVVGLIRETDRTIREKMENHFVGDLKELGYDALSSFKEYGPKAFENMDEATALSKIKTSGADAVLTIVLLDKEKERHYVPGRTYYSPYGYYYRRFWGYYGTLYHRIYEPGYYVTDTKYFWESNLYDINNDSLVYSAQTQSFSPANTESLAHEYGKLIVKNMVKQEVLHQQPTALKPF